MHLRSTRGARLLLILVLVIPISACKTTSQALTVKSDIPSAKLSIRSPAGKNVFATFSQPTEQCKWRNKKIKSEDEKSRAVKTYSITARSKQIIYFHLQGGAFHDYSCRGSIVFDIEPDQHYLLNVIADRSKKICRNRVKNLSNPEQEIALWVPLNLKKDQEAPEGAEPWMCDRHLVSAPMTDWNEFKSSIFFNNATFSTFGPVHQSTEQREN